MTVIDLHPEDLLDKDARGELSADERARLDAHLTRCSACRAEQLLRADFAEELDGEDRPSAILGLVQGALAAKPVAAPRTAVPIAAAPSSPTAPPTAPSAPTALTPDETAEDRDAVPSLRRRPRRTAVFLLVAAAVLAASAAGATGLTTRVWHSLHGTSQELTHPGATSTSTSTTTTAPAAPLGGASIGAWPAGVTVDAPSTTGPTTDDALAPKALGALSVRSVEPEAALAAPPPVALTAAAAVQPSAFAPVHPVTPAVSPAAGPALSGARPTPSVVPSAIASASASDLFDSANSARRSGDTAGALARYEVLERQFPQSREARVAKATTGRLLLDRGDAAGALARFDAYLASGASELREEAMAGRATALERLGRDDEETRAWATLLATYPRTPYAAHARARVARSLPQ